ncbi:bifunctional 2-polyprenyl-6-hydroxyphenol methylase/3-demethylubiquinol 3-O-methyltransferase UbiG [uncultured Cellulomonas sp.]|uniref:class I SAM-dependent methyltransferase n=1 Tax=uncultured Cellulomonas sp. TaxID=189682 RepID=UPI0026202FED|nr:class I SAM-dependent methyltransferase [uncultured Cellulomonas sp.]
MTDHATPVRRLVTGSTPSDGVHLLGESQVQYVEPAELTVMELLAAAEDISADSPELDRVDAGSAVTYHVNSRRSNVVRFLDLPATAHVLEIGAGCGAVTRYLGETCAVVDAVEPMHRRAQVARQRCRDLPNVEVFAGEVADVPAEPVYDVALVNGVLEYVGNGTADHAPYEAFLRDVAARLRPGGVLVLAIENALGVKYVVGSPEDHTDREYDSLEGYPRPNHARVFSRAELTGMLERSGLGVAQVLGAFPDYKRTAVLLGESLDGVDPSLAHRIPPFPSPDRRGFRHRVADEHAVWRTLVRSGLTWQFPNSFVVLAHTPGPQPALWPDGRHAVFARNVRRREFSVRTVLEDGPDGPVFRRERHALAGTEVDGVRCVAQTSPYQPGDELLDVLAAADESRIAALLGQWADVVRDADWSQGAPLDLLPHNMIVAPDGRLVLIDDEYRARDWSREDVLARGALTLGLKLPGVTAAHRWAQRTVEDLVLHLGAMVGLGDGWLAEAVRREATLRRTVRPAGPAGTGFGGTVGPSDEEAALWAGLRTALADGPLDLQAIRRVERLERHVAELEAQRAGVTDGQGSADGVPADRDRLAAELAEIRGSRAYRAVEAYRSVVERVRAARRTR